MNLIISNIKADLNQSEQEIFSKISKEYNIKNAVYKICKKSIDARKKDIKIVYSVMVTGENLEKIAEKYENAKIKEEFIEFIPSGTEKLEHKPIVIGFGPAGIFSAYELAKNGYEPQVFELGEDIDNRDISVENFLKNGVFSKNSNIQFGEGGAGSYSDGKLTTRTNDNRCDYILDLLHKFGAPEEILYIAKPHIGTDILKKVVKNLRLEIIRLGGSVNFNSKLTDLEIKDDKIVSISINDEKIPAQVVILAIGHSSRDTFELLHRKNVYIEPKAFAIGARIEHLQSDINNSLYHTEHKNLPIGEYNLAHTKNGRGCYTFCMCPGGVVVPSNSEENTIVTNGMSYHARDGLNANSAVVVAVNPSDYMSENNPLSGMYYQREIEKLAFSNTENYKAPVCLVGDFLDGNISKSFKDVKPTYEIGTQFCDFTKILPKYIIDGMQENLRLFSRKISAFNKKSAILTAPETRTSSPIRIKRNEDFYSINTYGLIPCGEGAGYAGGIISASVDGLKCAEKIMQVYKN